MKQLAERELGRIRVDVTRADKSVQDLQDQVLRSSFSSGFFSDFSRISQLSNLQNAAYRATERLEQFKTQMNYNQEALEQWALAAKQKDEDSLALAKYLILSVVFFGDRLNDTE